MKTSERSDTAGTFPPLQENLATLNRELTSTSELTDAGTAALERAGLALILDSLHQLGWRWAVGQRFTAWELMRDLGVLSRYDRLILRMLSELENEQILAPAGVRWVVRKQPTPRTVAEALADVEQNASEHQTVLATLRQCGPRLSDVLNGTCSALEVVFPNGDSTLVNAIYNAHPGARIMNSLLRRAFEEIMKVSGHVPRVLEAGAGTGATTAHLRHALEQHPCEYTFSDVSSFFLNAGRANFGRVPGMRFGLLDLDRAPEDQGFQRGRFDVIVAANMLHACKSASRALGHVRRLLAPEGVLLLLETTTPLRWLDLVFGLTDGWWAFTDWRLRPAHPLMPSASWLSLLTDCGFRQRFAIDNVRANQSLFVCRTS